MKKLISFLLTAALFFSLLPFAHASQRFSDVPRSHWAYEAIMDMAEKGIISGYKDGTFRPDAKISRAEFAKIMIAAADIKIDQSEHVKQTFIDVSKRHWAFYYVELAKSYLTGYKAGSIYLYKPDEYAVREDIAVALVRLMGYDRTQTPNLSLLDSMKDEVEISKALRPYIALALQNDLIKGFNDRTFRPQSPITRAEAASLLYRAKLDEVKIVFPPSSNPKPPTPPQATSITDTFSDSNLDNWKENDASGTWGIVNKAVTAYSPGRDLDHYLLPLNWNKAEEAKHYEIGVDVIARGTDGLGGLYFDDKDAGVKVVYVEKGKLTVASVPDAEKDDVKILAQISYKLQTTNILKVTVEGGTLSVSLNGSFVFEQKDLLNQPTKVGLYLKREATVNLPEKATFFDNFTFKALPN